MEVWCVCVHCAVCTALVHNDRSQPLIDLNLPGQLCDGGNVSNNNRKKNLPWKACELMRYEHTSAAIHITFFLSWHI